MFEKMPPGKRYRTPLAKKPLYKKYIVLSAVSVISVTARKDLLITSFSQLPSTNVKCIVYLVNYVMLKFLFNCMSEDFKSFFLSRILKENRLL